MKLAVFDFDGTIIESKSDIATLANMFRKTKGLLPKPIEEIRGYIGDGVSKLLERAAPEIENVSQFKQEYLDLYLNNPVIKTELFPNVKETLFTLRDRKYILAILTNKPELITIKILNYFGMSEFFHIVIGEDSLSARKPDPITLNYIINELQADINQTFMIGDGINDVLVAKNAGVKQIYCKYGYGNNEEIIDKLDPDFSINSFSELTEILY